MLPFRLTPEEMAAKSRPTSAKKEIPAKKKIVKKEPVTLSREEIIRRKKEATKKYNQISLSSIRKSPSVAEAAPAPKRKEPVVAITSRSAPSVPGRVGRVEPAKKRTPAAERAPIPPSSCAPSSSSTRSVAFEASAESLAMLKSGSMRLPTSGRTSTLAGRPSMKRQRGFVEPGRPSMLPLGINVFDKTTSEADKQKVYDYLNQRNQQGRLPSSSSSSADDSHHQDTSSSSLAPPPSSVTRSRVRFQPDENAIREERESVENSEAVLEACQPTSSNNAVFTVPSAVKEPHSILKKKKATSEVPSSAPAKKFDFSGVNINFSSGQKIVPAANTQAEQVAYEETPRRNSRTRNQSGGGATSSHQSIGHVNSHVMADGDARAHVNNHVMGHVTEEMEMGEAEVHRTPEAVEPEPVRSAGSASRMTSSATRRARPTAAVSGNDMFSYVFRNRNSLRDMSREMIADMMELMGEAMKEKDELDAGLLDQNVSDESLIDMPTVGKKKSPARGFRAVKKGKAEVACQLRADQEVMLLNQQQQADENATSRRDSATRFLRARQRNPLAETLGGASPFVPIAASPARARSSLRLRGNSPALGSGQKHRLLFPSTSSEETY